MTDSNARARSIRLGLARPRGWLQVERRRVDAVTLAGRTGSVVEDVAEVRAAVAAANLGTHHAVAVVGAQLDALGDGRLREARPTGARLELGVRAEQLVAAGRTAVHPVLLGVRVLAAERRLGPA